MKIKKDPEGIQREFEAGQKYKSSVGVYETYAMNEDFYIGEQWRGVDADDMPKPVVNILRRVVSMHNAKVCSEDWTVQYESFQSTPEKDSVAQMLSDQVDHVIERLGLKAKTREAERNECVDGDACMYFDFDADAESGMNVPGMVTAELLENINVYFGNKYSRDVQSQPWIIIHKRMFLEDVRDEARENGVKDEDVETIRPDSDDHQMEQDNSEELVSVFIKLWKQNGTVWAIKTVKDLVIRKEWDTGYKLYPIAWSSWETVKSSYHGRAMLTGLIPNQIAINKAWAGVIWQILRAGFAQPVYNSNVIKNWDGSPGQVIEASGPVQDVRNAVMFLEPAAVPMSVINAMDSLISITRDCMGASDATMGNVRPDNASAIIALQQADEQPLELRKQAYHDFVESMCRIIADIMRARYGKRQVMMDMPVKDENGKTVLELNGSPKMDMQLTDFDFSTLDGLQMNMRVDVGASSLYSEQLQVQTLSNLLQSGVLDDPAKLTIFLQAMPRKYVPAKAKLERYCQVLLDQVVNSTPQMAG